MSKVSIVGVEGSGKTVLMASLSECYGTISGDEPYLMPENQSACLCMHQVAPRLRVDREWPGATGIDALRTMKWTLRHGQTVLKTIEMLDYPGELYRLAFGERTAEEAASRRAELDEFLENLADADTLIVLFNLADLGRQGDNARSAETAWITRGIFDYAAKLPNLKRRHLVFTQADRYAVELSEAGGAAGLYARKLPRLRMLHPDLPVTALAAVDGMDDEGRPKPGYSAESCRDLMRVILAEQAELNAGDTKAVGLGGEELLEFVWCPPGSFLMGSTVDEPDRHCDEVRHPVTLKDGFWIGKTVVTQAQWEKVMRANPSCFKAACSPVERVSWDDCQGYIQKLNELRGSAVHGAWFRLPTEAEWEYACRAGSAGPYGGTGALEEMGWYSGNSGCHTYPVAQKKPNAWGVYDMHGNVMEWCQDWYGDYGALNALDPAGPGSGEYRVYRGGGWYGYAGYCRSANRNGGEPGKRLSDVGFRLVMGHPGP
jgi:formylglycine-generating enzyme required for sulfatase activity